MRLTKSTENILTHSYSRVFKYKDFYYAISAPGLLYRSKDGLKDFAIRTRWLLENKTPHSSVYLKDNKLFVFYTQIGDNQEHIMYSQIDLGSEDWNDWRGTKPMSLLFPEFDWEGRNIEKKPSLVDKVPFKVNQHRDPYVFEDIDNRKYLFYTGGGEQAIGIRILKFNNYE